MNVEQRLNLKEVNWSRAHIDFGKDKSRMYRALRISKKRLDRKLRLAWDQLAYTERYPLTKFVIRMRINCRRFLTLNLP